MTMVRIHECYEKERRLLEVIRELEPSSILFKEDPRLFELTAIKQTLHANDSALQKLCELNPQHRDAYKAQWQQAEEELDKRAAKLRIKCL